MLLDVSTLKGVITFNLFVVTIQTTMLLTYGIMKMRRAQHEPQLELAGN
jgi:hypothetical protein